MKQMVREHSTLKEVAATVRQRRRHRSRRRRSSKNAGDSPTKASTQEVPSTVQLLLPPPPPPPHLPLPAQHDSPSSSRNQVQQPSSVDAWLHQPPIVPPTEPQSQVMKTVVRLSAPTSGPDQQFVPVLRSLMNAIRTLLITINTPSALSALQVLEALDPVLANLE